MGDGFENVEVQLPDAVKEVVLPNADQVIKAANDADYTTTLSQIAELLAYQDMMLMILNVTVVLFLGVFCGWLITQWMRNR